MWLIPSRSRPSNLARLFRAMRKHGAKAPMVVRCDTDDDMLSGYDGVCDEFDAALMVGPRVGCGASYNEIFARYPDEPWYGCIQDDVVPETYGFEQALVSQCRGGIAYPDDGLQGRALPTNPVIDGDIVRRLGWIALPLCKHMFIDDAWKDIGRTLDHMIFMPRVKFTHLHHVNKKAPVDDTYRGSEAGKDEDRRAYANWARDMYPDTMRRLGDGA